MNNEPLNQTNIVNCNGVCVVQYIEKQDYDIGTTRTTTTPDVFLLVTTALLVVGTVLKNKSSSKTGFKKFKLERTLRESVESAELIVSFIKSLFKIH